MSDERVSEFPALILQAGKGINKQTDMLLTFPHKKVAQNHLPDGEWGRVVAGGHLLKNYPI